MLAADAASPRLVRTPRPHSYVRRGRGVAATRQRTTQSSQVYGGRLAFQWDVRYRKETAPVVDATALAVREAPGKGRGVFAAAPLAAGAFLGSYAGEVLDGDAFAARYGAGAVPDYVIRVDGDCFVDGRAAAEADDYSPSLLNHGENGNVVRYCATRRPPRVDFFLARDVGEGEELVFDYGEPRAPASEQAGAPRRRRGRDPDHPRPYAGPPAGTGAAATRRSSPPPPPLRRSTRRSTNRSSTPTTSETRGR